MTTHTDFCVSRIETDTRATCVQVGCNGLLVIAKAGHYAHSGDYDSAHVQNPIRLPTERALFEVLLCGCESEVNRVKRVSQKLHLINLSCGNAITFVMASCKYLILTR
jgi:hypothetical protein